MRAVYHVLYTTFQVFLPSNPEESKRLSGYQMRGRLPTGRIDLGKFSVRGYILEPRPAAIIIA
jgi:hypothetical protein